MKRIHPTPRDGRTVVRGWRTAHFVVTKGHNISDVTKKLIGYKQFVTVASFETIGISKNSAIFICRESGVRPLFSRRRPGNAFLLPA